MTDDDVDVLVYSARTHGPFLMSKCLRSAWPFISDDVEQIRTIGAPKDLSGPREKGSEN